MTACSSVLAASIASGVGLANGSELHRALVGRQLRNQGFLFIGQMTRHGEMPFRWQVFPP